VIFRTAVQQLTRFQLS